MILTCTLALTEHKKQQQHTNLSYGSIIVHAQAHTYGNSSSLLYVSGK